MKKEKLVIGRKYVAHTKSAFSSFNESSVLGQINRIGQPFIYFTGEDNEGNLCFDYRHVNGDEPHGDIFLAEDVVPYKVADNKEEPEFIFGI